MDFKEHLEKLINFFKERFNKNYSDYIGIKNEEEIKKIYELNDSPLLLSWINAINFHETINISRLRRKEDTFNSIENHFKNLNQKLTELPMQLEIEVKEQYDFLKTQIAYFRANSKLFTQYSGIDETETIKDYFLKELGYIMIKNTGKIPEQLQFILSKKSVNGLETYIELENLFRPYHQEFDISKQISDGTKIIIQQGYHAKIAENRAINSVEKQIRSIPEQTAENARYFYNSLIANHKDIRNVINSILKE